MRRVWPWMVQRLQKWRCAPRPPACFLGERGAGGITLPYRSLQTYHRTANCACVYCLALCPCTAPMQDDYYEDAEEPLGEEDDDEAYLDGGFRGFLEQNAVSQCWVCGRCCRRIAACEACTVSCVCLVH